MVVTNDLCIIYAITCNISNKNILIPNYKLSSCSSCPQNNQFKFFLGQFMSYLCCCHIGQTVELKNGHFTCIK